jgi:hypothetical protein
MLRRRVHNHHIGHLNIPPKCMRCILRVHSNIYNSLLILHIIIYTRPAVRLTSQLAEVAELLDSGYSSPRIYVRERAALYVTIRTIRRADIFEWVSFVNIISVISQAFAFQQNESQIGQYIIFYFIYLFYFISCIILFYLSFYRVYCTFLHCSAAYMHVSLHVYVLQRVKHVFSTLIFVNVA